jgi:hypothetical protein
VYRGYLLLEAGIAGGMAAAVLAGLLVQLASAQTQATLRARDVTSQAVAATVLNEVRARAFEAVTARPIAVRQVAGASYSVEVRVTDGTMTVPMPSITIRFADEVQEFRPRDVLSLPYKDIVVTSTYLAPDGRPRVATQHSRVFKV